MKVDSHAIVFLYCLCCFDFCAYRNSWVNYFIFIALSILAGVFNYKRIRGTGNPFQGSENMKRRKVFKRWWFWFSNKLAQQ